MNKYLKLLLFLFIPQSSLFSETIVVDWNKVKEETIKISSFSSQIEYIPLETTRECLLGQDCRFYLTKEFVIAVIPFNEAYLFNRKNGKFIHKITQRGNAPCEFSINNGYEYGLKNNILYVDDGSSWKGIDILSRKVVEKIKKPVYVYNGKYNAIKNPWPYSDSLYWGYVNNITGTTDSKLVLFNRIGKVLKEIKNTVFYEKMTLDRPYFAGMFYEYSGETYFKQYQGNDTVFHLRQEGLSPHIIFNWDKQQLKYQSGGIWIENQIYFSFIQESNNYIFFDCQVNGEYLPKASFCCLYDKKQKKIRSTKGHGNGFADDIDNLEYFCPTYATNSELIEVISAEKWLDWKERKMKSPVNIQVQFDDNPILRIVYLKE